MASKELDYERKDIQERVELQHLGYLTEAVTTFLNGSSTIKPIWHLTS